MIVAGDRAMIVHTNGDDIAVVQSQPLHIRMRYPLELQLQLLACEPEDVLKVEEVQKKASWPGMP